MLKGLREGRVYVRARGPAGPTLQFEAISQSALRQMGDTVPNAITDLTLWVAVSRAVGQRLEWVRNGEVISTTSLTERQSATLRATVQAGDWLSVILRDDAGPTLFSNAIYIAQR